MLLRGDGDKLPAVFADIIQDVNDASLERQVVETDERVYSHSGIGGTKEEHLERQYRNGHNSLRETRQDGSVFLLAKLNETPRLSFASYARINYACKDLPRRSRSRAGPRRRAVGKSGRKVGALPATQKTGRLRGARPE
jgi:hypothetical protein